MPRKPARSLIPLERIQSSILLLRGERVLLDTTLAEMYGVEPKALLQAVRRNMERFLGDFIFQLSDKEFQLLASHLRSDEAPRSSRSNLRSQTVTSSSARHGGRRYRPFAFTEQGVAMLSSVLRSERAVRVNIEIMRTFARLRKLIATHEDIIQRLDELESRYDAQFRSIFDAIRELMTPVEDEQPAKPPIGFRYEAPAQPNAIVKRARRVGSK
jgi:hypothetical protein